MDPGGYSMKSARYFWITVLSCLLILSCTNLFGQANATSSLQGTVMDKSQAVLGGAEVTLTDAKGEVRTTKTDGSGVYRFESLPAGGYTVKGTNAGFSAATAKNPQLLVGASTTQKCTLYAAAASATAAATTTTPQLVHTTTH